MTTSRYIVESPIYKSSNTRFGLWKSLVSIQLLEDRRSIERNWGEYTHSVMLRFCYHLTIFEHRGQAYLEKHLLPLHCIILLGEGWADPL